MASRDHRTPKFTNDLRGRLQWLLWATEKAYVFVPNAYTWDACCAAKAVAQQIRKESTQPRG